MTLIDNPNPRCPTCNKKINITNRFICKCEKFYCTAHRYPESHSCEKLEVFKEESIKKLSDELVKLQTNKLPNF